MSDSRILAELWRPWKHTRTSLFGGIPASYAQLTDDKETIAVIAPEKKNVDWGKVFDTLQAKKVRLASCEYLRHYDQRSDWKSENLQRDMVVGAALWEGADDAGLANPPEDYDPLVPGHNRGFLARGRAAIIERKPKGLFACALYERLFSKTFCDFLRENVAEFDTEPVVYKGEELQDWFRVIPSHRVDFLSPECLSGLYYQAVFGLDYVDRLGSLIASQPLPSCVFAMDNRGEGVLGLEPFYVVNLDLLQKMLNTFKKIHQEIDPVFSADGPVGRLFHEVMARAKPLLVEKPQTKEEALAAQIETPKEKPAEKAEPEPEPAFRERRKKVLASMKGKEHTFEIRESAGTSGGASCDEDEFDYLLLNSGRLPKSAWQAPVTSWMLARLCAEGGEQFKLPEEDVVDGGSVVLEFLVRDRERKPVAGFQLQGDTFGIAILGSCRSDVNPRDVIDDFAALLLREPEKLAKCSIRIYDPEWREDPDEYEPKPKRSTRNKYGWDGRKFLGADNVWCASDCGHERPDRYEDYLNAVLEEWRKSKGSSKSSS